MNKNIFPVAVVAGSLLLVQPQAVLAQDRPAPPPALKPGRSAGVHIAQQTHTGLALIGASAIIAVVIVVASASSGGSGNNNQVNQQFAPTTTTP
jgi:hypothetical protein